MSEKKKIPSRNRLKYANDIRRMVANATNDFRQGKIDAKEAKTIGYMGQIIMQIISSNDFEQRLKAIEEAAKKRAEAESCGYGYADSRNEVSQCLQ